MDQVTDLRSNAKGFAKKSMLMLCLLGVLGTLNPEPALAARSGGRAGGRAPSRPAATRTYSRPAPQATRTRVNNYNIGIAPPIYGGGFGYGGYGMGYSPFIGGGLGYYGFGWNPALTLGLTLGDALIRETQR